MEKIATVYPPRPMPEPAKKTLPPDVEMMDSAIKAMIQGAPDVVLNSWDVFIAELVKWRESVKPSV